MANPSIWRPAKGRLSTVRRSHHTPKTTSADIINAAATPGDVISYGMGPQQQRFSSLDKLNTSNVKNLVPVFAIVLAALTLGEAIAHRPAGTLELHQRVLLRSPGGGAWVVGVLEPPVGVRDGSAVQDIDECEALGAEGAHLCSLRRRSDGGHPRARAQQGAG